MADESDRRIRQTFRIGEYADARLPAFPLRPPLRLTPSERHIVALVFQNKTEQEIAKARGISVRTVLNRLTAIFRKLGLSSKDELIALLNSRR